MCSQYVNFTGTIKVPACCKYANKIANFAIDIGEEPNQLLSDHLHFL